MIIAQRFLGNVNLPKHFDITDIKEPVELFILYLMFDCWIGNQDRHDQNWGFVLGKPQDGIFMAPSFDHASSMACRMSDRQRSDRLKTKDLGYSVDTYLKKAKTPFYSNDGSRQLKTLECFQIAVVQAKKQKKLNQWLEKLESIDTHSIKQILGKVPPDFGMSEVAVEFTANYLEASKQRLLGVKF